MDTNTLDDLRTWFAAQCDGEWERTRGVRVESTGHPGWRVRVDIAGTPIEKRSFEPAERGNGAAGSPVPPWMRCRVVDGAFVGEGDPDALEEILHIFLAWAAPRSRPR